ncbi:MAG TPA: transcriptional repressor [Deltaproteobacteria bacterium]|nr:transcriptional repressor [Deltaproteobacteria bacterium]
MDARTSMKQRWNAYLKEAGLKSTRQRRALFDCFVDVEGHISLDEMLSRVHVVFPGVGYATVYRTMKLFVQAGIADERQFGDGQARYEPIVDEHDHHDHIICRTCGHIFEFEDDEIERLQAAVVEAYGLRIVEHRLDIWADCQSAESCEHRRRRLTAAAS